MGYAPQLGAHCRGLGDICMRGPWSFKKTTTVPGSEIAFFFFFGPGAVYCVSLFWQHNGLADREHSREGKARGLNTELVADGLCCAKKRKQNPNCDCAKKLSSGPFQVSASILLLASLVEENRI